MNADFELILEDCLTRLRSGASIEECLMAYPAQAEALSPLLLVTSRVRKIVRPQARPEAVQAGLERVLTAMSTKSIAQGISNQPISKSWFSRYTERIFTILRTILFGKENKGMKFALRLAMDMVVILVVGLGLTVNASASSLPGDPLYGVKRTWEEVRLGFSLNDQAQQALQNKLLEERRQEVQQLLQLRRPARVEFEGYLQSISADEWVVDGIHVKMQPDTIVQGNPAIGTYVWIRAQIQSDGSLVARQVRVMNENQPVFPYPGPGMTSTPWPYQTPWSTPMPGNSTWPTREPNHMPWATDQSTHMPQPTYDPTHMPMSTYQSPQQPWPTHDSNHDNDWDHHNDSGGSSWSGDGSGSHHSWP